MPLHSRLILPYFSPVQPYQRSLAIPFFACSLHYIVISFSSGLDLLRMGMFSMLFSTLYYSFLSIKSIVSAAVIHLVSSYFTYFAFPSLTSPAYTSFGAVTFIRTCLSIRLSRRESVVGSRSACLYMPYSFLVPLRACQEHNNSVSSIFTSRYIY